jgi:hypothetical protein
VPRSTFPGEPAWFVAKLLLAKRHRHGTPRGSRTLTCFWQAVLGLRWFRDRTAQTCLRVATASLGPLPTATIRPTNGQLHNRLDSLTALRRTQALAAVCDQLIQAEACYPSTDFVLRYEVRSHKAA